MPALTDPAPSTRGPATRRRRPRAVLGLVLALLAGLVVTAGSAGASPGAPWFQPYFDAASPHEQQRRGAEFFGPGEYYTHNFPDPDVLLDDGTYYAYGTSTGGSYLPVMTSTDLVNWAPRRPYDKDELDPTLVRSEPHAGWMFGDEWFNDALLQPAAWGGDFGSGRMTKELWAPGVLRIGDTYAAYYAVRLPTAQAPDGQRFCLSVATSSSPIGPFYDRTSGPLQCAPVSEDPRGSIDPEPFLDSDGTPYLLWKTEGKVDVHGPNVYVQELDPSGTSFARGSSPRWLMTQDQSWEGYVIENPSMVEKDGQYYLFYSGNSWNSNSYATGYALCAGVTGPCTKPRSTPLMTSSAALGKMGAGGASAFLDKDGALRLAYHSWRQPSYVGYPTDHRRMAVTTVSGSGSQLTVGPDAPAGPTPPPPPPTVLTPDEACPVGVVPANAFSDDNGSAHERAIDCVKWWGVTAGKNGLYEPLTGVTRAQMATFLANAIDGSGGTLAESPVDFFSDDDGSPHERNINRLAAVGVVSGKGPTSYAPGDLVTRAQMATFLVRAVKQRTGEVLVSTRDYFGDDGGAGAHEANINAAAAAGLASGTSATSYTPNATVRRDQMASFLARVLEFYVERDAPLPG